MAFEVTPLKPETKIDSDRISLARDLFKRRGISIEEASKIAGISTHQLEEMFLRDGVIKNDTILVCGGAGFIGSNFVRYIMKNYSYDRVIVYDALTYAGNLENLKEFEGSPRYSFFKGNIVDKKYLSDLVKKEKVDYIINFAAETHVTRSLFLGATEFLRTNVVGVHSLLEIMREFQYIRRLVHVSTDEVYGTLRLKEDRKFFEDDLFDPNVPYSVAKAGGDMLAKVWHKVYGVPVIVTHCTNNYGSYQHPEKLIPSTIFKLMNNEPAKVHGRGQHIRDWIFVEDHCRGLNMLLRDGSDGEVYNLAGNEERSTIEIVSKLLDLFGRPKDFINFVQDRPNNDLRYALNCDKIKQELGWEPTTKIDEGLKETVQWYKSNAQWVRDILDKDGDVNNYV